MRPLLPPPALALILLMPGIARPVLAQAPPAAPDAPAAPSNNVPANGTGPVTGPPAPPGTTTTPAPQQPAPQVPNAPPPAPPNYDIQYNGYLEFYYLFQSKNPKFTAPGATTNNLGYPRVPDIRHNTPTLDYAELNVFQKPRPNRFGFTATLAAGDSADETTGGNIVGGPLDTSGLGETRFRNVQQLYATYALGGSGSGIDVGKWYGPSYEYGNANGDYNFSRAYPFVRTPAYNAGARIYAVDAVGLKGLTATFQLIQTVTDSSTTGVQDNNKQPAYLGQLSYSDPKGKFSLNTSLSIGKDKSGDVNGRVSVTDNNFTYNFSANTLAAVDYYHDYSHPDGGYRVSENGLALYFRQRLTPRTAFALRTSGYDSHDETPGTPDSRPYEVTATYDYKASTNFLTRLEYRHDNANGGPFPRFAGRDGAGTQTNQDTLEVAGMFTF